MTEHRLLTGASLHEPKGVETATSGQVYVANGTGSGSWSDPSIGNNYLNKFLIGGLIPDISTAGSSFLQVVPQKSVLSKAYFVFTSSISGSDDTLTVYKNGIAQTPTIMAGASGSGKGVTFTALISPTIAFNDGDTVEVRSSGGSTGVCPTAANLVFTATT